MDNLSNDSMAIVALENMSTAENTSLVDQYGDEVLCEHCLRTKRNGIRCPGICVADSDYWFGSHSALTLWN